MMHRFSMNSSRSALTLILLVAAGISCTPQAGAPTEDIPQDVVSDTIDAVVAGTVVENLDTWDPAANGGIAKPFALSPETLDYRVALTEQTLVIRYFGAGNAAYSVAANVPWASVDRPNGTIVGGWVWLYVAIDRSQLPAGTHAASLEVRVGDFEPQTVSVAVKASGSGDDEPTPDDPPPGSGDDTTIPGDGELRVSAERLDFGAATESLDFVVRNVGESEVTYSLASNAQWLTLSSTSGVNSGAYDQITAFASRNGLNPGGYSGVITVDSSTGDHFEISALMIVPEPGAPPAPELAVSPSVIDLLESTSIGFFNVANAGDGTLNYTVSSLVSWLAVDPSSGDVGAEPDTIQVAIDRSKLSVGAHLGTIRIQTDSGMRREVFVVATQPDTAQPPTNSPPGAADDPQQILAWLRELEPLQKVHYSSALPPDKVANLDPLIVEYVRLTHAACVKAEGMVDSVAGYNAIKEMIRLCKTVDQLDPTMGTRLGLTYSPWHHFFPADKPPTYVGPEHQQEIDVFRNKMANAKRYIDQVNAEMGTNYQVGCIDLDTELFYRKEAGEAGAAAWNAAMDVKYNAFYDICKQYFPNTPVEWHGRGGISECFEGNGWCQNRYFTMNERGDRWSIALYSLPEFFQAREAFRRTYAAAQASNVQNVTAILALGCGYVRRLGGFDWTFDWDYDLLYSWQFGAELNNPSFAQNPDRYAPWNAADFVIFYPEPFGGRVPHWGKHFVAYVRGANLISELPE